MKLQYTLHMMINDKCLIAKVHSEQWNKEDVKSSMEGTFIVFISLKVCKYQLKTFFNIKKTYLF